MVYEDFLVAFGLAALANHFCPDAFPYDMDQMRIEAFQHVTAVVDARRLLNIAGPSVSESIIVRMNYLAVVCFTSDL